MSLPAGAYLGPYEILAPLGKGGMADVYRARDPRLGRAIAIKVLASTLSDDPERRRRFTLEAKAASALNHPNIVTIHEIGEAEIGRFIVMELVEGQTLRKMIQPAGLPPDSIAQTFAQVAKALAVAHAAGIVHRDIKPENIMVRNDGYVKVLDFGVARLIAVDSGHSMVETTLATDSGRLIGTTRYMSPEQVRCQVVGTASDIFSLGIVLYEMATGHHPFVDELCDNALASILSVSPVPPARLNPQIGSRMDALTMQMLQKDPAKRPSAMEVDAILVNIAGGATVLDTSRPAAAARHHTVGRSKERKELRTAFDSAAAGRGLLLCVHGEPGMGKTTLVEDFLSELSVNGSGCIIARGACSERLAGTEAYLPFLEALENLLRSDSGDSVGRTMRLVAPNWYAQMIPGVSDPSAGRFTPEIKAASQERLKRELSAFLQEISHLQPLVLFLDDLHWADVSTVDMLAYIAAKISSMRILILVSYRPSDLMLAKHPFLPIKLDLQLRGTCREIALDFLARQDIEEYLSFEFPGHQFPTEFRAFIHSRTEGNPLFLVDLLRHLRARQTLIDVDGRWMLAHSTSDLQRDLPESVRSMVQRMIEQVNDTDRQLLVVAGVQGHEFDSAVVAKVLDDDPAEVEERLEQLERVYGLVRLVREREFPDRSLTLQYRFVHVLYQNTLYASLAPTRRGTLSAAVARALTGYYGEQSNLIASELALLFEAARDFSQASHFFLVAARNAVKVFANQEAITLAKRGLEALKAWPDTEERAQQELVLQVTLGGPLMATRGFAAAEVEEVYARARELSQQLADPRQRVTVLAGSLAFYWVRGDSKHSAEVAEELSQLAREAQDPGVILLARHSVAVGCSFLGEQATAGENFKQAMEVYNAELHSPYAELYSVDIAVSCCIHGARTLWMLGYPDQAATSVLEGITRAQQMSHLSSLAFALMIAAKVYQLRREIRETLDFAEKAISVCTEHGLPLIMAWSNVWQGWALVQLGKFQEGIDQMRQGLATQQALHSRVSRPHMHGLLAETLAGAGRFEEGMAALKEGLETADQTGERYYVAELHRLKGELLIRAGEHQPGVVALRPAIDDAKPEECFLQAIEIARQQSAKSLELRAAISLTRLYSRQQRKDPRKVLKEVYEWFTEGFDTADLREARDLLESV